MKRSSILAGLAFAFLVCASCAAFANPFTGGAPVDGPGAASFFSMPFLRDVIAIQQRIYAALSEQIRAVREGQSLAPLMNLLLFSFLYGVFHILGPGHGKSIVASWFIGHKARFRDGFLAACVISAGHTITAIALVGVLNIALEMGQLDVLDRAQYGEAVGYGLIALIGLWLLVKSVRPAHKPGCSCCCCAGHAHDHPAYEDAEGTSKQALGLFGVAGLVPCSGSMIILLFTLAQGVFWAGLLGTLAVALGMILAISGIGIVVIFLRQTFVERERPTPHRLFVVRALEILAALVVFLTGLTFLLGSLYGILG